MTNIVTGDRQLLYNIPSGTSDYVFGLCYGDKVIISYRTSSYNSSVYELDTTTLTKKKLTQVGFIRNFYLYNDKLIIPDENEIIEYNLLSGKSVTIAEKSDFGYTDQMLGEDIKLFSKNKELWVLSRQQNGKLFSVSLDTHEVVWTGLSLQDAEFRTYWSISEKDHCIIYYKGDREKHRIDLNTGVDSVYEN